ncbi:hypothetical protein D9756_008088 [Leucocoprinus leucothites]|uniref:PIH1 N-terminal domain-containing protein n=1 Tax=Leucocoprinus leucothites TaxID=201217 RepID=A0A8H5D480_9AGAR|nr:hypothetical protein D9756_008088 [Leucoagaricus leucothites]
MASTPKLPIDLMPTPGFCIKSTVVNPATLRPPTRPDGDNLLEPVGPLVVPAGQKVFINLCYDKNVPPPPPADEQTIKRAMSVQEYDEEDIYYVPVVVSQPRQDKDKDLDSLGFVAASFLLTFLTYYSLMAPWIRPSITYYFHPLRELLWLSRQIGTPNITAKGKLEPRRVWVPAWLATGQHAASKQGGEVQGKSRLIQEVDIPGDQDRHDGKESAATLPKLKGILKHNGANRSIEGGTDDTDDTFAATPQSITRTLRRPAWSWKKEGGERLMIIVDVAKETPYDAIRNAALDVEPRRLVLRVPGSANSPPLELDVDLNKSDAEIVANNPGISAAGFHGTTDGKHLDEPNTTLLLKRQRDFDVEAASAEWRVAEGKLVINI